MFIDSFAINNTDEISIENIGKAKNEKVKQLD